MNGFSPTNRPWLLALGRNPLPASLQVAGQAYSLVRPFKHDFFAATALYQSEYEGRRVVLKIGRTSGVFGIPTAWIGRLLSGREIRLLRLAQGLQGIPLLVGHWGETGFVHAYIEGHPLNKKDRPPDDFFPRLSALLDQLHARGIAYVDLEKPENVLLGDDGRPYLFDFQISWHIPENRLGGTALARRILGVLQRADRYHLLKHWRRLRPDQLDAAVLADTKNIPIWIRWHRIVFRPLTLARRQVLVWLGVRSSIKVRSPG